MGNHSAGKAMGVAADMWWQGRGDSVPPTKDEALAVLDQICMPWAYCDAEFEASDPKRPGYVHPEYQDYRHSNGPLGKLILIAFEATPEQLKSYHDDADYWYEGLLEQFSKRYDFY